MTSTGRMTKFEWFCWITAFIIAIILGAWLSHTQQFW